MNSDKQSTPQFYQEIYQLRPWYHNFDKLGIQTDFGDMSMSRSEQLRRLLLALSPVKPAGFVEKGEKFALRNLWKLPPNSHQINQRHKEMFLLPFLEESLQALPSAPRCLDLFCADGYYSCWIGTMNPQATVTGVDLDADEIHRAETAVRVLNLPHITFELKDIREKIAETKTYDLVMCAGGLYHLTNPRQLLQSLTKITNGYLIIQSAVTLETEDPDYFVTPAPGWKHGSRFTHAGLKKWLLDIGWQIIKEGHNELTGNPRLSDRGSSYFLCRFASTSS